MIDGAASGISERLIELAGVEPGSRVSDVAAGHGEPSLTGSVAKAGASRRHRSVERASPRADGEADVARLTTIDL